MLKVLWLDDDSPYRGRRQIGEFEVISARSYAEASEVIREEQPLPEWAIVDLIVRQGGESSIYLRIPGLEFIKDLKTAGIKTVVYSVLGRDESRRREALAAGALRVFDKTQMSLLGVLDEIRDLADAGPLPDLQPEDQWQRTIATLFEQYFSSARPLSRAARIELHTAILATTDDAEQRRRSFQTLELLREPEEIPSPAHAATDLELQALRALVNAIVEHKRSSSTFDAFLCYNSLDAEEVEGVAKKLLERGVLPWLDRWQIRPGERWRRVLEGQILNVKSAVVFVGEHGICPWQDLEIDALLQAFAIRGAPVIPALLPTAPVPEPALPLFLRGAAWVDLRYESSQAIERLIWAITGWKVQSIKADSGGSS